MPVLYILSGSDVGRTYDVADGALLGRVSQCDVVLRDSSVSRTHARLERRGETWVVVDQGSRNGMTRDGRRAKELELEDGATFELGQVELRFRIENPGVSSTPPTPVSGPKAAPPPEPAPEPEPEPEISFDVDLEEDEGEIVLEGEELLEEAPPAASPPPGPSPVRSAPAARPAPSTNPAASGAARAGVEVRDAGRPVLQYSKQHERKGFLQADLAQYPLWVKCAAGLLVAAVFAAIFYAAYRGTSSLKERAGGTPEDGQVYEEEL